MVKYFKNLFLDTWIKVEQNSIENNQNSQSKLIDKTIIITLIYIALGLSIVKYYGDTSAFFKYTLDYPGKFRSWFCSFFYGSELGEFHNKLYWIATIVLFYLIIPILMVKFVFKKNLKDYGFSFKNVHKDYPLYLLMLAFMLPIVYFASSTQSFQDRYPIFQPSRTTLIPLFIYWQIAYFMQFVAVEFFFRGFILHSLKNRFGFYSIFISVIPYCMVHYGKPFGETIAAIIAGIVLGTLSLKSRSIFLGILIHYTVAITMDLFALYREGIL
jgi:uncharacterized protein